MKNTELQVRFWGALVLSSMSMAHGMPVLGWAALLYAFVVRVLLSSREGLLSYVFRKWDIGWGNNRING